MKARVLLVVAAVLMSCSGCASEQRAREQERFDQAMTALEQANSLSDFFKIETNTFNMRVGDRFEEVPNPDLIAQKRRQWYISKHPDLPSEMKEIILSGRWRIGMSKDELYASRGVFWTVNRNVFADKMYEQVVYGHVPRFIEYFYFENGILTSWQD